MLFLSVLPAAAATEADLQGQINAKAQALEEVTKKIQETQNSFNDTVVRSNSLKQEIGQIDASIKSVNLGIQKSQLSMEKLGLEIESLGNDIRDNEKLIEDKRAAVTTLLLSLADKDNENLLIALLNNKSLADSFADAQELSDLKTELIGQVAAIRELRNELLDHRDQVTRKKSVAQQEHENLRVQKTLAEDQKTQRAQILTQTKNQEKLYQQQLADLQAQQQSISTEIDAIEAQLRATYNASGAPNKRAGVLSVPINSEIVLDLSRCGKSGFICTQSYGATNFAQRAYRTKFHNGIDFGISIGTPIIAAADGVITAIGNNGRLQYGKWVLIKHGNNLSTLYAHMSRQIVTEDKVVKRGDVIGYSGNTGYATGPHLHFSVYLTPSIQLKSIARAGIVPIGFTLNPLDYL